MTVLHSPVTCFAWSTKGDNGFIFIVSPRLMPVDIMHLGFASESEFFSLYMTCNSNSVSFA